MPESPEIVVLDPENAVEGLLSFYRARTAHVGEAHERMAGDFAAALVSLAEAERKLSAMEARIPVLASFGYARCGIAKGGGASRPAPAEPL